MPAWVRCYGWGDYCHTKLASYRLVPEVSRADLSAEQCPIPLHQKRTSAALVSQVRERSKKHFSAGRNLARSKLSSVAWHRCYLVYYSVCSRIGRQCSVDRLIDRFGREYFLVVERRKKSARFARIKTARTVRGCSPVRT